MLDELQIYVACEHKNYGEIQIPQRRLPLMAVGFKTLHGGMSASQVGGRSGVSNLFGFDQLPLIGEGTGIYSTMVTVRTRAPRKWEEKQARAQRPLSSPLYEPQHGNEVEINFC